MANVLQLSCVSNNGNVERDLGADYSEIFLQVDVAFNAAYLAAVPGSLQELIQLSDNGFNTLEEVDILLSSGTIKWTGFPAAPSSPFAPTPAVAAMQFYRVRFHLTAGSPIAATVSIDGTDIGSFVVSGHNMANIRNLDLEALGLSSATGKVYYDNLLVGTTLGGSDIYSDNFEGTLAGWNNGTSNATIIADPGIAPPVTPTPPAEGMVGIAFDDTTLEPSPTWTWIDLNPNLVASWTVDRGRSFELDQNDTGRATVTVNDYTGILDPLNSGGTYYGKLEPPKQITLQRWNPVTAAWSTRYRGFIDDFDYTQHPSQEFMQLTIGCVDGTEILSAVEMVPGGIFGKTPPVGSEGNIAYYGGTVSASPQPVDDRIIELYTDSGWPAGLATVFSGNVDVQPTIYSPGESIWTAILEAADAEFPGVANVYFSKDGKLTFHGRYARFDPVGVSASAGGAWTFTHWKCGDIAAVKASITDTAQIRAISFNRGLAHIVNAARATYFGIPRSQVSAQVYSDATSISTFGVRSWSADDLILEGGKTTNVGDPGAESLLYAQYYVENFKDPKNRISSLVFKSLAPHDTRAAPLWDLLCNVEISDMIDVHVKHPLSGTLTGGFTGESFFVEGIHEVEEPSGSTAYNLTTVTLDVSPQGYYAGFPGGGVVGASAVHAAAGKAGTVSIS
jgi:hypothetical protein